MTANLLALDQQLCFPLYAASHLLTRLYRPLLERLGLTYPQYLVMMALWEQAPRSVGELGELLHLDSGTLTPLLKRLEGAGLVTRTRAPEDERRVLITLTAAGKTLRQDAQAVPEQMMCRVPLAPEQFQRLRADLQALVTQLAEVP